MHFDDDFDSRKQIDWRINAKLIISLFPNNLTVWQHCNAQKTISFRNASFILFRLVLAIDPFFTKRNQNEMHCSQSSAAETTSTPTIQFFLNDLIQFRDTSIIDGFDCCAFLKFHYNCTFETVAAYIYIV